MPITSQQFTGSATTTNVQTSIIINSLDLTADGQIMVGQSLMAGLDQNNNAAAWFLSFTVKRVSGANIVVGFSASKISADSALANTTVTCDVDGVTGHVNLNVVGVNNATIAWECAGTAYVYP